MVRAGRVRGFRMRHPQERRVLVVFLGAMAAMVAVIVGAAVWFGGGEEPRRGPSLDEAIASRSAEAKATATGTPSPTRSVAVVPDAAREHTQAGAVAFLEYFVDESAEAFSSADSATVREISGPKCAGCKTIIRLADELEAKGQNRDRDAVTLAGYSLALELKSTKDRYVFDALIDERAGYATDRDGNRMQTYKAYKATLRTTVTWDGSQWFIEDARKLVG
ncbi:MAG: DUF6318 family protein [Dermatophilaceae bacterium]